MIELHSTTLANGLRVAVAENHKAPVVTLGIAYKVGSKNERPEHTGLAHLFEHLMFDNIRGDGHSKYDLFLTEAGGESNAYTTYDYTYYHCSLPSAHAELGAWLESQRMTEFIAPPLALETQINVVSEEILQTVKNRPYGTWRELQAHCAYSPNSMYSWEVHGSAEHVQHTNYSDAMNWYNQHYHPANACLIFSGDISHNAALSLAEKYFAPIVRKSNLDYQPVFEPSQRKHGTLRDAKQVPLNAFFESFHFDGIQSEECATADILCSVLSSGRSSRLYQSLIYQKQIANEASAYTDKREHTSLLTVFAVAREASTSCDELRSALQVCIDEIRSNGITAEELEKAKKKLRTSIAYELQTSDGVADVVAQQVLFWNDAGRVNTLMDRYNAVTVDHVNAFTREVFREHNSACVEVESPR